VQRLAFFILFLATISVFAQEPTPPSAQDSKPQSTAQEDMAATATPTVSDEVLSAEAAIAKSDWKSAETRLATWLASHPTDARALFDAGYVADNEDRPDDAGAFYRRAISANEKSFEAHLSLGLLLARQGKPDDARPELSLATTLDPGQAGPELKARAWRALARIDRNSSPADASNDLIEALKLTPETVDDTLLAASLADQTGQYETAEAAYRRVLAKEPKSVAANAGLAHLMIARKQYPEAEALLRAALAGSPEDVTLNAQLAAVLAAEDKAEALPLLEKLHSGHPDLAAITRMLAEVRADAGDYEGSDRLFTALLAADPNDAGSLASHGQNLIRLMKYDDAYAAFDKATQIDPADGDGWSGLAFAASQTNRPSVVLHALTERSKYLPESPSTYFLWASAYDALHDKKSATAYYHHFLESAGGKYPTEEAHARQRLQLLAK
jgi:tetratricopeptide (TPR) repeat protein